MTKEEALKVFRSREIFDLMNYYTTDELQGMIDEIVSTPSIPSNLDEAAEKYSENILANNEDLQDAIEDAFKAGAEWMAGQYEKIEGVLVEWYSTSDGKDYCCGVKTIEPFEVPEGFYIRKKQ